MQLLKAVKIFVEHKAMHAGQVEDREGYFIYRTKKETIAGTDNLEKNVDKVDKIYVGVYGSTKPEDIVQHIVEKHRIIVFDKEGQKINQINGLIVCKLPPDERLAYLKAILTNL